MKRREIMKLVPAALVVGAAPVAAQGMVMVTTPSETPVMQAYRQWKVLKRAEDNAPSGMEDAEFDSIVARRSDFEAELMKLPCENAKDWIIKVKVWTGHGEFSMQNRADNPQLWDEACALIGGAA